MKIVFILCFISKILVYIFDNFSIICLNHIHAMLYEDQAANLRLEYEYFAKGLAKLKLGGVMRLIK